MRDDFTAATKRRLAERAGYICSNPECRRNQLGPAAENDSESVNLGRAAHICAAAPGGPRYDADQLPDERSSLENGIFLCATCADLVDKNNGGGHTAETLLAWKNEHENWIEGRLSKGELDSARFDSVIWQENASTVGAVAQAQTVNIVRTGITYSDARDIALDVYKANYLKLSEAAAAEARKRAEELTDEFLTELKSRNPEAISSLESPGMQHALFGAQKEYARTGDQDLEKLLVDILVDRAALPDRSIKQIVLDEALEIAPKLTPEQMDALTIGFLIRRTQNRKITNLESFGEYLESYIVPFLGTLSTETSCYEHINYTGCGTLSFVGSSIGEMYLQAYHGLFVKGFDDEEWKKRLPDRPDLLPWALTKCLHDPTKLQVNAINDDVLTHQCKVNNVSGDDEKALRKLFNLSRMSEDEVKSYILNVRPELQKLFDVWESTQLSQLVPTSVGIAVAHANYRRRTGDQLDLGIWIR